MAVEVQCPECGRLQPADEALTGQEVPCGNCGRKFTVVMSTERTIQPDRGLEPVGAHGAERQPIVATAGRAPTTIGRYAVVRKLGAGAMGVVWLAHDPQLERDVAIKVLPDSVSGDAECLKRFLREARLAARLHHPNTVTVYDVGADGDLNYMVMELVEGGSLGEAIAAGQPMDWREATRAVRDAAAGLAAAHKFGLVHRDVKPENLMRTCEGVTKVADFGLARSRLADSRYTQQGTWLGTPAYIAPELWQGGEADARSDLYALALTYYHLLTARLPFAGEQFLQVAYQHVNVPLPDPRAFAAGLPDEACRLLVRGAAKAATERHADAAEFAAELDALLALPPQSLTVGTPREEPGRGPSRQPSVDADDVLVLVEWEEQGQGRSPKPSPAPRYAERLPAIPQVPRPPSPPRQAMPREVTNSIGLKLMLIPAGTFQMGSNEEESETPIHRVRITKPFYLGVYPVTQDEYQAVMGKTPSRFAGNGRLPVENVSWNAAVKFCKRLSAKEGREYRLPTEAQWEYACRAGSRAKWCFGDNEGDLGEYAWYKQNSGDTTHPVGGKMPNAWGLYDMHGNVWEWCEDWYDNQYYAHAPTDDPMGPTTETDRVMRGGESQSPARFCRSARRGLGPPNKRAGAFGALFGGIYQGFRVSLVPADQ